jgi:hypothetical protein
MPALVERPSHTVQEGAGGWVRQRVFAGTQEADTRGEVREAVLAHGLVFPGLPRDPAKGGLQFLDVTEGRQKVIIVGLESGRKLAGRERSPVTGGSVPESSVELAGVPRADGEVVEHAGIVRGPQARETA